MIERRRAWLSLALGLALGCAAARAAAQDDLEGEEPALLEEEAEPQPDQFEPGAEAEPPRDEAEPAAESAAEDCADRPLLVAVELGIGAGQRGVRVPVGDALQRLDTDYYPALSLGLRGAVQLSSMFSLGFGLRYQTSLGLEVEETRITRLGRRAELRSHHVQFGVLPGFRLAKSDDAVSLSLLVGWSVRGLRSVTRLSIPPFTLHGPLLRANFLVPLGSSFSLRLAPELMAIVGMSGDLRTTAGLRSIGYGLGVELGAVLYVQPWLAFELGYRDASLRANTYGAREFTDTERSVLLRTSLEY